MIIKGKDLIGLRVETKSGQFLGKIKGFFIETDNLKIKQIIVTRSKLLDKILIKELVIGVDQIIEITEKEMLVNDNIIESTDTVKQSVSV